jgi:hypothetical protein
MSVRVMLLGPCLATLVAVAGCGGSSKTSATGSSSAPTSAAAATSSPNARLPSSGGAAVSTARVRAAFRGANHAPTANRPWAYSVHVTDGAGKGLSGTVGIEFTFGGQVVGRDNPPVHPIEHGLWHDALTFPHAAIGQPLTLRAVVHTSAGSFTLAWPVTVRQ